MPGTQEIMENLVYDNGQTTDDVVMESCMKHFGNKINEAWLDAKGENTPSPFWAHLAAIACTDFMKGLAQELRTTWEEDIIAQLDELLGRNNSKLDNELLRITMESEERLHAKYSRNRDGEGIG